MAITGFFFISACEGQPSLLTQKQSTILPGAYNIDVYVPALQGKKVGVVVNHTSMINETHLVDSLLTLGIDITMIFSPEHGFKGTAYNGEKVTDDLYKGRIPVRSLYGKSRKPSHGDISTLDVVLFDIQDVGARFYTYISTLHYVMETSAEASTPVVILDRPNPNGHYVDGPLMMPMYSSFIGMHPVPVVYGMTIGEYGQMINGEEWLKDGIACDLSIIACENYDHSKRYDLPILPSPNLPNQVSIALYPSLCLLEGTIVSAGRGTDMQFQVYGHPKLDKSKFTYTPRSMSSSKYPKHQDIECGGVDLRSMNLDEIRREEKLNLSYIISAYNQLKDEEESFFLENGFINKLAGTDQLKKQILSGSTEAEIRSSWQQDLDAFRIVRSKYLLYN